MQQLELFCLQWESASLLRALRDCKQRSLTVSKKAPTASKKASPFKMSHFKVSWLWRCRRPSLCVTSWAPLKLIWIATSLAFYRSQEGLSLENSKKKSEKGSRGLSARGASKKKSKKKSKMTVFQVFYGFSARFQPFADFFSRSFLERGLFDSRREGQRCRKLFWIVFDDFKNMLVSPVSRKSAWKNVGLKKAKLPTPSKLRQRTGFVQNRGLRAQTPYFVAWGPKTHAEQAD